MTPIHNLRVVESRKTYIPHLLIIALLWAGVMSYEFYEREQEALYKAEQMTMQMVDCLNGVWVGTTQNGTKVACFKADTLEKEDVSHPN